MDLPLWETIVKRVELLRGSDWYLSILVLLQSVPFVLATWRPFCLLFRVGSDSQAQGGPWGTYYGNSHPYRHLTDRRNLSISEQTGKDGKQARGWKCIHVPELIRTKPYIFSCLWNLLAMDSEKEHKKCISVPLEWRIFGLGKVPKRARRGDISPCIVGYLCSTVWLLLCFLLIEEATFCTLTSEEPPFRGAVDCESWMTDRLIANS